MKFHVVPIYEFLYAQQESLGDVLYSLWWHRSLISSLFIGRKSILYWSKTSKMGEGEVDMNKQFSTLSTFKPRWIQSCDLASREELIPQGTWQKYFTWKCHKPESNCLTNLLSVLLCIYRFSSLKAYYLKPLGKE